jgi:hypothetical protein
MGATVRTEESVVDFAHDINFDNLFKALDALSAIFPSNLATLKLKCHVCGEGRVSKEPCFEIFGVEEVVVVFEDDSGDEASHRSISFDLSTVVSLDRSGEYVFSIFDSVHENGLDIFCCRFVDLCDIVLISDRVNPDGDKNALAVIAASQPDDLVFIVNAGVDKLEEEIEVLGLVLV